MTFDPIRGLAIIRKLTSAENWRDWKSDIQALFTADDSWEWISGTALPTDTDELSAATAKLKVAAYCITMTCDTAYREMIQGKTAPEMYKKLKTHYEGDTPAKRMELRRSLYRLEHDPANPVIDFINSIRKIVSDLTAIGHAPKPDEIRDITLMNLHPSFEVIRTILVSQEKNGEAEWTLDTLGDQLNAFESSSRLANGETTYNTVNALATRAIRSGRDQHYHRSRSDNWTNAQNLPDVCVRCGHLGHVAQYCFRDMPEHVKDRIRRRESESANVASITRSSPHGSLTLSTLRSTLDSGHTVTFYPSDGVIFKNDSLVGKITYSGNAFNVQKDYIPMSYATIEDNYDSILSS